MQDSDRSAGFKLHEQISESLRSKIRSGELPVGSRLPREADLMETYGVARGTVRRALRTLSEEGIVQILQGKGTYVRSGRPEPSIGQRLVGLSEAFSYAGRDLTTKLLDKQLILASDYPEFPGEIDSQETLLYLDRVRFLDGVPVARLYNWVRLSLAPGMEDVDYTAEALFHALDRKVRQPVESGQRTFQALLPDDEIASSLEISALTPLLFLRQTTYLQDGSPVECSNVWMDSQQVAVSMLLSREP